MQLDDNGKARIICEELNRSPNWQYLWGDEKEIAAGIVKIYGQFSIFDDRAIDLGVRKYWEEYCGNCTLRERGSSAKLFLFLRIIYDVPETFPVEGMTENEQNALGEFGFASVPGYLALLRPLKKDINGRIVLCVPKDHSSGHGQYNGLEDYGFLLKHFPRRRIN
jgi:hypothetical protein